MTQTEILKDAAESARLSWDDGNKTRLVRWGNRALDELFAFPEDGWWFLKTDFEETIVAGTRSYDFKTEDIYGNENLYIKSVIAESVRVGGEPFPLIERVYLDKGEADWLLSTNTGSPQYLTIAGGRKLVFSKVPDAAYVTSLGAKNLINYCASKQPAKFVDTTAAFNASTQYAGVPEDWHWILPVGVEAYAWQRQGSSMYRQKKEEWRELLLLMQEKCIPFVPTVEDAHVSHPESFTLSGW